MDAEKVKNTIDLEKLEDDINPENNDQDTSSMLTYRDFKNLKKNRYFEIKDRFSNSFILENKSGSIAELKAANPYHACKLIGWNPKQTKVINKGVLSKNEESMK